MASPSVYAQSDPLSGPRREPERPSESGDESGTPAPMTVRLPPETEVVGQERGVINPQLTPTFPLEEPLDPKKYICGRGDTFELNFWGQQNFRLRATVDLEGRTFISKIGYVDIVGKTLAQARDIMKKLVRRYYPGLNFDMSLVAPRTFMVHVVGFVPHPGLNVANPLERVSAVLAKSGGVSDGSRRRIEIARRDGSRATADLVMYDLTGDTKYNPFVMDGDVIRVPFPGVVVTISGAVKRPGSFELIASQDLRELLDLAGGFRSTLTTSLPVRVIHRDEQQHAAEEKLAFGANGSLPEYKLHDQDSVIVPSVAELQRSVLLIGPVVGGTAADEVTTVRRLAYFEGATVRQLIEGAGGLGASADLKNAYIRRSGGATENVDLERLLVLRDFSADRPVRIGDSIVVPQKRRGVIVEGAVMHPGIIPYNPAFGGSEYIDTAGGPSKDARGRSSYQLISSDGHARRLTDMLKIEPGDSILVPQRSFSRSEVVQLVMGGVGLLISSATLVYLVVTR